MVDGTHPLHFVLCTLHFSWIKSRRVFWYLIGLLMMTSVTAAQVYVASPKEYRFAVPPDEVDLGYSPLGPASLDSAAMRRLGQGDREYVDLVTKSSSHLMRLRQEHPGWRTADRTVRNLLDFFAGNPYLNTLRQEAASTMLWHFLLSDTVTTARQDAVTRYVDLMLASRHPDADLLERALQYLSIHDAWPAERRADAAERGAAFARDFIGKKDADLLERVGMGDMPEAEELNTLVKKRHARIARAALRLERMAERLR